MPLHELSHLLTELGYHLFDLCLGASACSALLSKPWFILLPLGLMGVSALGMRLSSLQRKGNLIEGGIDLRARPIRIIFAGGLNLGGSILAAYLFERHGLPGMLAFTGLFLVVGLVLTFGLLWWTLKDQTKRPALKEQFIRRLESERFRNEIIIDKATIEKQPDSLPR